MEKGILAVSIPEKAQITEITALVNAVNRHDGTGCSIDLEDDFRREGEFNSFLFYEKGRLISAINLFTPGRTEAEISAFTHPDFRRRGCFTSLRLTMEKELRRRGIPSQLYVCDRLSAPGKAVIQRLAAEHDFSEYQMTLTAPLPAPAPVIPGMTLSQAKKTDMPELAKIMSEAFGDPLAEVEARADEFLNNTRRTIYTISLYDNIAGMIGVYQEGQIDYIHGFCLGSAYRGKGLGKAALIQTAALCRGADPSREIHLEVETENENALSLYLKAGFRTQRVFDYYRRANPQESPG